MTRHYLAKRIYPARPDSLGVQLFTRGGKATVRSLDVWQMGQSGLLNSVVARVQLQNAKLGRHPALLPQFLFQQSQTLVDDGQGLVKLFLRNDQRRVKAQIVTLDPISSPASTRNSQTPFQGQLRYAPRHTPLGGKGLATAATLDQFNAQH